MKKNEIFVNHFLPIRQNKFQEKEKNTIDKIVIQ